MTKRRASEQDVRRAGESVEPAHNVTHLPDCVTVDLVHVPTEGAPALRQWFEIDHVPRVAEGLLSIRVYDGDEVRQFMVCREHDGFPHGSLIALGVAQDDEDAPLRFLQTGSERRSSADRQAVAETACAEVNTLHAGLRM